MSQGRVNPNKTLEKQGITGLGEVHYNLMEPDLVQQSLCRGEAALGQGGTILVETGKFTGRSPNDKHIVKSASVEANIWWDNNRAMSPEGFDQLHADMLAHMKGRDYFVQDLYAGADAAHRLDVRLVT